uniref:Uncharacterized protein n=1 Tax=Kalanchoe fedtschenkoi TaxID=63787 RepID=A0A7N0TAW9_KALFE
MGCAQSRIENEEAVSRCKERKNLMKEAVASRNAFAAGHSGYAMSLKNTGAALSDFAQGEVEGIQGSLEAGAAGQPLVQTPGSDLRPHMVMPPPPPPLPNFSPSPLKRSVTMPEISKKGGVKEKGVSTIPENEDEIDEDDGEFKMRSRSYRRGAKDVGKGEANLPQSEQSNATPVAPPHPDSKDRGWDYFFNVDGHVIGDTDEEEVEKNVTENEAEEDAGRERLKDEVEMKTPEKMAEKEEDEVKPVDAAFVHSNIAPAGTQQEVKVVPSIHLLKLLEVIDDHFLKASESAQEVSKMLEANQMHYHSNFANNRGHIDHSARVMRVITWNKSLKGPTSGEGEGEDIELEEYESHATVLDKLLAWEKKLYEEVKAGELIKLEYQRKVALLNKQKKRGATAESLEKLKATISHLHTKYIVDMQSMDSTVAEVNDIRDHQLYPKLVALVEGMAGMWESMSFQHDSQLKIVTELKSMNIAPAVKETTKDHHERTRQLFEVVQKWHSDLEKLVTHQKHYVHALHSWLKLNLIPIESSLKEKISSPPRIQIPPIQPLLSSWHDFLERMPDELALTAIASFAAVLETILRHQEEEMKLKDKVEETRKDYLRKKQAFEDWYQKHMPHRSSHDEMDPEKVEEANPKDPVADKRFLVESLKKKLDDEVETHQRLCLQVREKSLGTLKIRLPELFRALSDYAHECSEGYGRLRSVSQSNNLRSGARTA